VAAHVGSTVGLYVAMHEVLLGERNNLAVLDLVSTLHSTGGEERPARAAGAMVLDRGHGTGGGPVHGGRDGSHVGRGGVHVGGGGSGVLLLEAEVHSLSPLLHGHVGELVVAKLVGGVKLVVGLNNIVVVGEVLEHGHEVGAGLQMGLKYINMALEGMVY